MFGWGRSKNDGVGGGGGGAADADGEGSYHSGGDQISASGASEGKIFKRGMIFDSIVVASPYEKASILKMFTELRAEGSFCDVAFLCQGVLFRAHRVIVRYVCYDQFAHSYTDIRVNMHSSWSRWLRALLTEGSDEEVVSLDVFDPDAFGKVLDYMYGAELVVSLEVIMMDVVDGLLSCGENVER
jgi:hypothetical protein